MGVTQAIWTRPPQGGETARGPVAPATDLADEAELIERCTRDRGAFGVVYRAHYAAIVGYLFRRTGDRHAAEDLAAETFLAALNSVHRFRTGRAPIRSWLYRIATNQATGWSRRQRKRRRTEADARGPGSPDVPDAEASEELARARRALSRLREAEQSVLALHYFEGLGVSEIALALGWREGTVKSLLSRGRESLRRELEQRGAR